MNLPWKTIFQAHISYHSKLHGVDYPSNWKRFALRFSGPLGVQDAPVQNYLRNLVPYSRDRDRICGKM